jgi:ABC-2 type transport system permease protein
MGSIFAIVRKDLWQRIRDRSAILNGVGAPLLLTLLMSLAFGRGDVKFHATFAVVENDTSSQSFTHTVLQSDDLRSFLATITARDEAQGQQLLHDGKADAVFVIPNGFRDTLTRGEAAQISVLRSGSAPYAGQVAQSIAVAYVGRLNMDRLSVASAIAAGVGHDSIAELVKKVASRPEPMVMSEVSALRADTSMATQFAPAMGVFFLYFVAGLGVRSLLAERANGTFVRLLAAPIAGRAVLGGKVLATFLLGVTSLITMLIASSLLLRASWGPTPAAIAVIVVIAFTVTAIAACILTIARSERQAGFGMSIVTFGMALLGGNLVGLRRAPAWLRSVSLLTPNGWALKAFRDLGDHGGYSTLAKPLSAIAAIGITAAAFATARSERMLRP